MTNEEWIYDILDNGMAARIYKLIVQNITPSLEDSILILSAVSMFLDPKSASEIKQILYKNFPSQKDHERINYVFSSLESEGPTEGPNGPK